MDPDQQQPNQIVPAQTAPPPSPPTVVHVHHHPARDPGIAVILELLPGIMVQTFGIGNIYAGNVAGGILMMFGYWVAQIVNLFLCLILIGFITLPLTFMAPAMVVWSGESTYRAPKPYRFRCGARPMRRE